jgi:hypothetical protein
MRKATLLLLALVLARPAFSARLEGVELPDQVSVAGRNLVLNGLGVREATVLMVNVYIAGLYLEAKSSDPAVILSPEQPKRIVMKFVRSVGREKLTEAFTDGFSKNSGADGAALAGSLTTLNAAMTDVRKEDVIALTYVPDTGVTVTVKGKDAAVIPGADFQRVLFAIWLGANPPNVSLREGLLGRAAGH